MKRLYVTRGVRVEHEGDSPEDIGEFLAIDWESKEIIGTYLADSHEEVEIGRSRGASGMAWHDDKIYICCRRGLMSIDPDTYEEVTRAETKFGAFHGMDSDGHTLWLTSEGVDCLLAIRNDKLQSILCTTKYSGPERTPKGESHGLNAVGFSPSGEMFLMYAHKFHMFNWTKQTAVLPAECKNAPHDITFMDEDHCLYTQSNNRQLWKVNVRTGEQTCVVDRFKLHEKKGPDYAALGHLRGIACHKGSNSVFVMAAPGTIIEYDATTWKERDQFVFTKKREANPFELILDPRDWK